MTKTSQNRALLLNLGAITVLSAVSSIVFKLSLAYRDPISSDFSIYIEIAKGLSLNPATFDPSGAWPLGYPLALRALSFLENWHYAGAVISFISLLAVSIASFYILRTGFGFLSSFIGSLSIPLNSSIITWSVGHSSDMPSLAMAFLSIAFFLAWRRTGSAKTLLVAGACTGLSYLFRYSSLSLLFSLLLLIILLAMSLQLQKHTRHIDRSALLGRYLLIFIGGWIIAPSPQLVGSWLVHGNPLYNENGCNVALAIGWRKNIPGLTWANVKDVFPACKSLSSVIYNQPFEFFKNLLLNFRESLLIMRFSIIVFVGSVAVFFMASKKDPHFFNASRGLAITIFVIGVMNATFISLAFVSDRHLILSSSLLNCFGFAALAECVLNPRLRKSLLDRYYMLFAFVAVAIVGTLEIQRGLHSISLYRYMSARTLKSLKVKSVLLSYKCRDAQAAPNEIDALLIGDNFVDPDNYKAIGHQAWRKDYKPFSNPLNTSSWMRANSFNCDIVDEHSLSGRLPGFDLGAWKQEYNRKRSFKGAWKLPRSETYVFILD